MSYNVKPTPPKIKLLETLNNMVYSDNKEIASSYEARLMLSAEPVHIKNFDINNPTHMKYKALKATLIFEEVEINGIVL